jgi:hypothetical protein
MPHHPIPTCRRARSRTRSAEQHDTPLAVVRHRCRNGTTGRCRGWIHAARPTPRCRRADSPARSGTFLSRFREGRVEGASEEDGASAAGVVGHGVPDPVGRPRRRGMCQPAPSHSQYHGASRSGLAEEERADRARGRRPSRRSLSPRELTGRDSRKRVESQVSPGTCRAIRRRARVAPTSDRRRAHGGADGRGPAPRSGPRVAVPSHVSPRSTATPLLLDPPNTTMRSRAES